MTIRNRISIVLVAMLLTAGVAQGRITKVVITRTSSVFGGHSFAGIGTYDRLTGTAYGTLDPGTEQNRVITDIDLAKDPGTGLVNYSFSFYILVPSDLTKGNHKVMYEPPNRGSKTWNTFGRVPGGNDPGTTITDATTLDNAFLMPRGYTMVWSGWDFAAGTNPANFNSIINLPIAHNPDGSTITGPAFEYIVSPGAAYPLNYPAATLDKTKATLTHRVHLDDMPVPLASTDWDYDATGTSIHLTGGSFVANDVYEFSYTAKDPTVNGIGFAAIRDWVAWLRYDTQDDFGTPNPLAGYIQRVQTEVVSQPGRLLNDFRHLGFNQAENGQMVFDAMMNWIAAGDGINMNYRWSQPGRTERNRQDHLFAEGVFPFANVQTTDPFTGKRDSRLARCKATHTCPLSAEIYSANEYWVKAASLLHTTPDGTQDLKDSKFARDYFISSHQHGSGNGQFNTTCQQRTNPLNSAPVQRALWVDLDEWADGQNPPPTEVPRFRDGTLVSPAHTGFPTNIPNPASAPVSPFVVYTGLKTTRYLFDYGPGYYLFGPGFGVPTINPPVITPPYEDNPLNGQIYPSFVPKVDSDGNDIAGVRLVDVAVPIGTYTGWGLRSGAWANDGCESTGQFIPFAPTHDARNSNHDPRLSVQERYPTYGAYYTLITKAISQLVKRRLMLPEDVASETTRLIALGQTWGVPADRAPVAVCKNLTFAKDKCTANVNNGSYDPDGDKITITQSPEGPFLFGSTEVTLTVTDPYGMQNSCQAVVTVTKGGNGGCQ